MNPRRWRATSYLSIRNRCRPQRLKRQWEDPVISMFTVSRWAQMKHNSRQLRHPNPSEHKGRNVGNAAVGAGPSANSTHYFHTMGIVHKSRDNDPQVYQNGDILARQEGPEGKRRGNLCERCSRWYARPASAMLSFTESWNDGNRILYMKTSE